MAGFQIDQFCDNGGSTDIDRRAEYSAGRIFIDISFVDIGLNLFCGFKSFGENLLLEEPRGRWDRYSKVAVYMALTGLDFSAFGLDLYGAFSTASPAAADSI